MFFPNNTANPIFIDKSFFSFSVNSAEGVDAKYYSIF